MDFLVSLLFQASGNVAGDAREVNDCDHSSFYGFLGLTLALVLANLGAAYGTYKSGVGICQFGILNPDKVIKGVIPVIMAGILGIYGLIVAVVLQQKSKLYS